MNKRIRKKLHLAEFAAMGFRVEGLFRLPLDEAKADRWMLDFIGVIEARGLMCGGGYALPDAPFHFYVERAPKSATDEDRSAVVAWLRARPEVATVEGLELEDVYYPQGHARQVRR